MTTSPTPPPPPNPRPNQRLWLLLLGRTGIALVLILLTAIAAGAWWTWLFIQNELAPTVAKALSETLDRPVEIGALESVSFSGLRFDSASIPPTATDPNQVTVEAVDVGFNLLSVLWNRTLPLEVTLVRPTAYLEQTATGQWVDFSLDTEQREQQIKIELRTLKIENATITAVSRPARDRAVSILFPQVDGQVDFFDNAQRLRFSVDGRLATQGQVSVQGEALLPQQAYNLAIQGQNLRAVDVSNLIKGTLNLPIAFQAGQVGGNLAIELRPNAPVNLLGDAQLRNVTAQVQQVPKPFTAANGPVRFQGQTISLENVRAVYGQVPLQAKGTINVEKGFNLAAQVPALDAEKILSTLEIESPFETAGMVRGDLQLTGALERPILTGSVETTTQARVDRVDFRTITADFRMDVPNLTLSNIRGVPVAGGLVTGSGQINVSEDGGIVLDLLAQDVPGDSIGRLYGFNAEAIAIGPVSARAQIFGPSADLQTVVQWEAPRATYPGRGEVVVAGENVVFRNTQLMVEGGTVRGQGQIVGDRWQAVVQGDGVQLNRFSPDLRGLFSGNLNLAGTLDNLTPAGVRADGQVRFSQGLSLVEDPLTAQVRWDGEKIIVDQASAPGFSADGFVYAQLEGEGAPAISRLDLNVAATNYELASLPFPIPEALQLAGLANFEGRLEGSPFSPQVQGNLELLRFALNGVPFEPLLAGRLSVIGDRGLSVDVSGGEDAIALVLGPTFTPESFDVRRGEAIATGRATGPNQLAVSVANFPLTALNLQPAPQLGLGAVTGLISGDLSVDLAAVAAAGTVTIEQPGLGQILADRFSGSFRYADGVATLQDGRLLQGESTYLASGTFTQGPDPTFDGEIEAINGRVQDILLALQWFDIEDVGRGLQAPDFPNELAQSLLVPVPVGLPDAKLITQLRRYSEIEQLLSQQIAQREAASPLPELGELAGTFNGKVDVSGSLQQGVALDFDFRGEDWVWGPYEANQVIVAGNFRDGALTLLPLRIESDQTLLTFAGQVGGEQQSGQLRMEKVPATLLSEFVALPVDITGDLSATATLAGNLANPEARGEVLLENGTLNQTPVQTARGSFNYADARLRFGSTIVVSEPEPVRIRNGSIPYKLPFASVEPDSNAISLDINVKNEGLALLDLLTRQQVSWQGGEGEVNVAVRGTLTQPEIQGAATLNNATVTAQALPEPLTNLNGTIRFAQDRILVEDVRGQFSRGQVTAQGVLPIARPLGFDDPDLENPLTLNLDQLSLNLTGIYRGGADGRIALTGYALSPRIGGEITLSDGRVFLPENQAAIAPAAAPDTGGLSFAPPIFSNLTLTLGDRVQIISEPILSFVATGDLTLNGTLEDLEPDGTIRLRSGQVNLFTTQFNLARGYPQTAEFTPQRGTDPVLDIRLIASVTEVTRNRLPYFGVTGSEIEDGPATNLGALQTVRIQAQVQGPASQIFDNLELTSSPSRNRSEIIALLGGSFIDTLGRGDGTLAIANLAGSALLSNIQNAIGNALGLSEFRLFPTTVISDDARTSTLALGAEAGIDITDRLSFSVLQILTASQPTQYNIRYRLSDELLLRGGTDFSGDTRAVIEFGTRF